MLTDDDYRAILLEVAADQGILVGVTVEELAAASTRNDLALSSLNVILVIAEYINRRRDDVVFQPEWVAQLDLVDGIISVMREIDLQSYEAAG